jgi:trehalose utilization protein
MINITVWNESSHKGEAYPDGMSAAIKETFDGKGEYSVTCALLEDPEQGLPDELLQKTDVLFWWGHSKHKDVKDELVEKICKRVEEGMGAIFLHSAHFSKPFKKLMGTHCSLRWREQEGEAERIWTIDPYHPIAKGIPQGFRIDREEMYGEYFDIPKPDSVVFSGWFSGGNVFRSGCTFTRGAGRIFYFQPGHETFPIFKDENIRKIIENAVLWATKNDSGKTDFKSDAECIHAKVSVETIPTGESKKWFGK